MLNILNNVFDILIRSHPWVSYMFRTGQFPDLEVKVGSVILATDKTLCMPGSGARVRTSRWNHFGLPSYSTLQEKQQHEAGNTKQR